MNNELIKAALAKRNLPKADRDEILPGKYRVFGNIFVDTEILVGQDYETTIHQAAQPWALLAAALDKLNGVTVESLVREVESQDEAKVKEVKERTQAAIDAIKGTVKGTAKGAVKLKPRDGDANFDNVHVEVI